MPKLIFLFTFLFSLSALAQNTIVEIHVDKGFKSPLKLIIISNPLTGKEKIIATAEKIEEQKYIFSLPLIETAHFYIDANNVSKEIYLESGKKYVLKYVKENQTFEWLENSDAGINADIEALNLEYNNFLFKYFGKFSGRLPQKESYAFIESLNNKFSSKQNLYFKTYFHFKKAYIERIAGLKKNEQLADDYLNNTPFLFAHPAYIDFLLLISEGYFDSFLAGKKGNEARNIIKNKKSYSDLYLLFLQDSVWKSEHVRHVILLHGLKNTYFNKEFSKENVLEVITSATKSIKDVQLNRWAIELQKHLGKFISGKTVPEATFTLSNGEQKKISSYKGKALYISYFPKAGIYAGTELAKMQMIYKKAAGQVVFITLLDEMPYNRIDAFASRNNYNWLFGTITSNDSFKEVYEANDYPAFYLIDAQGKTFQIPAEAPSTDIERHFPALLRIKP